MTKKGNEIKISLLDKKNKYGLKIVESNDFDIFTGIYKEWIWKWDP